MKMAKKGFDMLTIGSAVRDIFLRSAAFEEHKDKSAPDGVDACLQYGSKVALSDIIYASGGGATNAAVTFANWGFKTACVARVGNDFHARDIIAELKRDKVETFAIQQDLHKPTGTSVILVSGEGHRAIMTSRGVSKDIDAKAIQWTKIKSRWIYMTSVAGNIAVLNDVFAHAKKTLGKVAWNPGNAELQLGLKKLAPYFLHTDILIMNREEAAAVVDRPPRDLEGILNVLGPLPREALVITDGAHGAYAHANGTTWYASAGKGKRVNTTGAGDSFGSGFTAGVMRYGDVDKALRCAALNALGVVTHMGAKAGILKGFPTEKAMKTIKVRQM